jgi:hypothetical protein
MGFVLFPFLMTFRQGYNVERVVSGRRHGRKRWMRWCAGDKAKRTAGTEVRRRPYPAGTSSSASCTAGCAVTNALRYRHNVTFREDKTRTTSPAFAFALASLNSLIVSLASLWSLPSCSSPFLSCLPSSSFSFLTFLSPYKDNNRPRQPSLAFV